ncbi:hypothetical protein HED49_10195 [Ochrobactrum daejeonense]|nr:hypothetical protein [Brucella daejeonensis]
MGAYHENKENTFSSEDTLNREQDRNKPSYCKTDFDHLGASDAVRTAALWYCQNHHSRAGPFIPFLRETFALTALEAIRAMQLGRKMASEARHG